MRIHEIITEGADRYVYRVDSKKIPDFGQDMKTYYHNKDYSVSGRDDFEGSVGQMKGIYAKDRLFTALYATGPSSGPNKTRYVAIYGPGKPTVWFDRKDEARLKNNRAYLTVFNAQNFKELPSGEFFSSNPGKPVKQQDITDPFRYIRQQGWTIKIVDNLEKVLKKVQAIADQPEHEIQYGAEGMG